MAGLAMETSKAEPADRNQAKAKLNKDAYVDSFTYVESHVDNNPYLESSVIRFAYVDSNPYVESNVNRHAYVESSFTHCCWYNEEKTYQLLFKVKKKRTADEQYCEENQQLSEQLLNNVITKKTISCWNELVEDETTAERIDNETAIAHQRRCISCCIEEKTVIRHYYTWRS
ncbi:hypothetical protein F511_33889 [Dorcoceras hygrometricum]|uniref:Uncharacterized protein n=1 Tax=Dorcoceras hygrometricum TaxID=472368 RepID=A0A2Z7CMG6_9LAMI|nr:hypothetical protein F511_33889 [Dorcoceras hygrometricum]